MPSIDLTEILITILTLVGSYGIAMIAPVLKRRLGVELDDSRRMQLAEMLHNGVKLVVARRGSITVETKNAAINEIARYLVSTGNNTLKDLHALDADGGPSPALLSRIEASLSSWNLIEKTAKDV